MQQEIFMSKVIKEFLHKATQQGKGQIFFTWNNVK